MFSKSHLRLEIWKNYNDKAYDIYSHDPDIKSWICTLKYGGKRYNYNTIISISSDHGQELFADLVTNYGFYEVKSKK